MSCPHCTTGGLLDGEPSGVISTQGAYFARAPPTAEGEETTAPKRAILLLTDAFGLPLKNSKVIADNLACQLKCDVWIPDYFAGKPLLPVDALRLPGPAGEKLGLLDWLKLGITILSNISSFISNRASVVDVRLTKFVNTIQEEHKYAKLGAVGYCFGGATAVRFGSSGLFQSAVVCHPGPFNLDQANAINIPTSWVCAEEDISFSNAFRSKVEATFAKKKGTEHAVDYEFKEYKGTTHGFATRPLLDVPQIKDAYQKAFEQVVEWFDKTLIV